MKHKRLIKAVSIALLLSFGCQELSMAQGGAPLIAPIRDERTLKNFSLPPKFGRTRIARYAEGEQSRTLIHIEDAHDSLEAQKKIASILGVLASDYDVRTIALEGASGEMDTALFKTYPDQTFVKEAAEGLVREGRLNAGEFFALTTETPISVYGVEEKTLYHENLKVFRDLLKNKEKIKKDLTGLSKSLSALGDRIYSQVLKDLKRNEALSLQEEKGFTRRWDRLKSLAKGKNLSYDRLLELKKLEAVSELEKEIHFEGANGQRQKLLQELKTRLSKSDTEKLVLESLAFKSGKISDADYYLFISYLASRAGLDPAEYPDLARYTQYLALFESLDLSRVFDELKSFEDEVRNAYFSGEEERTLAGLEERWTILNDMISGSASSAQAEYFSKNHDNFNPEKFTAELSSLLEKYHVPSYEGMKLERIFEALQTARRFYSLAEKRNHVLLERTLARMKSQNQQVAALVTGGFHTRGISELLQSQELSYLVIMPKITDPNSKRPYVTIITRKKGEYERTLGKDASRFQIMSGAALYKEGGNPLAKLTDLLAPLTKGLTAENLSRWMAAYRASTDRKLDADKVESTLLATARLAVSELKVESSKMKAKEKEKKHGIPVRETESLAKGDDFSVRNLSNNKILPQRRAIRPDHAPSSSFTFSLGRSDGYAQWFDPFSSIDFPFIFHLSTLNSRHAARLASGTEYARKMAGPPPVFSPVVADDELEKISGLVLSKVLLFRLQNAVNLRSPPPQGRLRTWFQEHFLAVVITTSFLSAVFFISPIHGVLMLADSAYRFFIRWSREKKFLDLLKILLEEDDLLQAKQFFILSLAGYLTDDDPRVRSVAYLGLKAIGGKIPRLETQLYRYERDLNAWRRSWNYSGEKWIDENAALDMELHGGRPGSGRVDPSVFSLDNPYGIRFEQPPNRLNGPEFGAAFKTWVHRVKGQAARLAERRLEAGSGKPEGKTKEKITKQGEISYAKRTGEPEGLEGKHDLGYQDIRIDQRLPKGRDLWLNTSVEDRVRFSSSKYFRGQGTKPQKRIRPVSLSGQGVSLRIDDTRPTVREPQLLRQNSISKSIRPAKSDYSYADRTHPNSSISSSFGLPASDFQLGAVGATAARLALRPFGSAQGRILSEVERIRPFDDLKAKDPKDYLQKDLDLLEASLNQLVLAMTYDESFLSLVAMKGLDEGRIRTASVLDLNENELAELSAAVISFDQNSGATADVGMFFDMLFLSSVILDVLAHQKFGQNQKKSLYEKSRILIQAASVYFGQNPEFLNQYAHALYHAGHSEQAFEIFSQLKDEDQDNRSTRAGQATVLLRFVRRIMFDDMAEDLKNERYDLALASRNKILVQTSESERLLRQNVDPYLQGQKYDLSQVARSFANLADLSMFRSKVHAVFHQASQEESGLARTANYAILALDQAAMAYHFATESVLADISNSKSQQVYAGITGDTARALQAVDFSDWDYKEAQGISKILKQIQNDLRRAGGIDNADMKSKTNSVLKPAWAGLQVEADSFEESKTLLAKTIETEAVRDFADVETFLDEVKKSVISQVDPVKQDKIAAYAELILKHLQLETKDLAILKAYALVGNTKDLAAIAEYAEIEDQTLTAKEIFRRFDGPVYKFLDYQLAPAPEAESKEPVGPPEAPSLEGAYDKRTLISVMDQDLRKLAGLRKLYTSAASWLDAEESAEIQSQLADVETKAGKFKLQAETVLTSRQKEDGALGGLTLARRGASYSTGYWEEMKRLEKRLKRKVTMATGEIGRAMDVVSAYRSQTLQLQGRFKLQFLAEINNGLESVLNRTQELLTAHNGGETYLSRPALETLLAEAGDLFDQTSLVKNHRERLETLNDLLISVKTRIENLERLLRNNFGNKLSDEREQFEDRFANLAFDRRFEEKAVALQNDLDQMARWLDFTTDLARRALKLSERYTTLEDSFRRHRGAVAVSLEDEAEADRLLESSHASVDRLTQVELHYPDAEEFRQLLELLEPQTNAELDEAEKILTRVVVRKRKAVWENLRAVRDAVMRVRDWFTEKIFPNYESDSSYANQLKINFEMLEHLFGYAEDFLTAESLQDPGSQPIHIEQLKFFAHAAVSIKDMIRDEALDKAKALSTWVSKKIKDHQSALSNKSSKIKLISLKYLRAEHSYVTLLIDENGYPERLKVLLFQSGPPGPDHKEPELVELKDLSDNINGEPEVKLKSRPAAFEKWKKFSKVDDFPFFDFFRSLSTVVLLYTLYYEDGKNKPLPNSWRALRSVYETLYEKKEAEAAKTVEAGGNEPAASTSFDTIGSVDYTADLKESRIRGLKILMGLDPSIPDELDLPGFMELMYGYFKPLGESRVVYPPDLGDGARLSVNVAARLAKETVASRVSRVAGGGLNTRDSSLATKNAARLAALNTHILLKRLIRLIRILKDPFSSSWSLGPDYGLTSHKIYKKINAYDTGNYTFGEAHDGSFSVALEHQEIAGRSMVSRAVSFKIKKDGQATFKLTSEDSSNPKPETVELTARFGAGTEFGYGDDGNIYVRVPNQEIIWDIPPDKLKSSLLSLMALVPYARQGQTPTQAYSPTKSRPWKDPILFHRFRFVSPNDMGLPDIAWVDSGHVLVNDLRTYLGRLKVKNPTQTLQLNDSYQDEMWQVVDFLELAKDHPLMTLYEWTKARRSFSILSKNSAQLTRKDLDAKIDEALRALPTAARLAKGDFDPELIALAKANGIFTEFGWGFFQKNDGLENVSSSILSKALQYVDESRKAYFKAHPRYLSDDVIVWGRLIIPLFASLAIHLNFVLANPLRAPGWDFTPLLFMIKVFLGVAGLFTFMQGVSVNFERAKISREIATQHDEIIATYPNLNSEQPSTEGARLTIGVRSYEVRQAVIQALNRNDIRVVRVGGGREAQLHTLNRLAERSRGTQSILIDETHFGLETQTKLLKEIDRMDLSRQVFGLMIGEITQEKFSQLPQKTQDAIRDEIFRLLPAIEPKSFLDADEVSVDHVTDAAKEIGLNLFSGLSPKWPVGTGSGPYAAVYTAEAASDPLFVKGLENRRRRLTDQVMVIEDYLYLKDGQTVREDLRSRFKGVIHSLDELKNFDKSRVLFVDRSDDKFSKLSAGFQSLFIKGAYSVFAAQNAIVQLLSHHGEAPTALLPGLTQDQNGHWILYLTRVDLQRQFRSLYLAKTTSEQAA